MVAYSIGGRPHNLIMKGAFNGRGGQIQLGRKMTKYLCWCIRMTHFGPVSILTQLWAKPMHEHKKAELESRSIIIHASALTVCSSTVAPIDLLSG